MTHLDLKSLHKQLQALPNYVTASNELTRDQAQKIADRFGDTLADLERELRDANQFSKSMRTANDTRGNGKGMFNNAERLFFGYVYDLHYGCLRESQEAARNERDYD